MKRSLSIRSRVFRRLLALMRKRFEALTVEQSRRMGNFTGFPLPKGTVIQPCDGIAGQWISCGVASKGVILYLHGGGYIQNTPKVHHALVAQLARASERRALYVDYRLAPEHVFPAALDDTMAAYQWLLAQNHAATSIILVGDSAGAGLALAAMVKCRDMGIPLPAAAVLLSPLCDLSLTARSAMADRDPIYTRETLLRAGKLYAGTTPLDDPMLSPVRADLHDLPPVLIQAGEIELLCDDAIALAEKLRSAGVQVTLSVYAGLWHVWQVYPVLIVKEARPAIEEIATFIRSH